MHQPAITNQVQQGQLKKAGRNKPIEINPHFINDRNRKGVPISSAVSNKAPVKKAAKNYNKQLNGGRREKAFSKNERKIACSDSRSYSGQHLNISDESESFALQNLLNFQYTSIRNCDSKRYQLSRRKRAYFNKEEYLQAKCRFVVTGSADDYLVNAVDPDKLVDWDQINLVYLPTHDPPNCPICLYSPIAAKMTRCGHIFCWSCILHYLQLGEKAWRKCPICHEAVHKNDLKSVKAYAQTKYSRLDTISMKLMKRSKDCVFAQPISEQDASKIQFSSWADQSFIFGSKIMLASPEEVVEHIMLKERAELRAQLNADISEQNGEETFISMALEILEEEMKLFKSNGVLGKTECIDEDKDTSRDVYGNESNLSAILSCARENGSKLVESAFSDDEYSPRDEIESPPSLLENDIPSDVVENNIESEDPTTVFAPCPVEETLNESTLSQSAGSCVSDDALDVYHKPTNYTDSYYFYQGEDGQNIFLHSVNARCLIEEYGSLDYGPENISGQIIDFECYTMTKELRKRFRYLSHLPLSSEFMICELILKPPLLSRQTIQNFMAEFKNRKALRLKKMKAQQKFDRQASAAGNKQHGFRVYDEDLDDDELGIDLSDLVDFPSSLSPNSEENENNQNGAGDIVTEQFQGLSFAQMLKTENAIPENTSPRKRCDRINNVKDITSTGDNGSRFLHDIGHIDEDGDGPDIVAPDFKQTFSAAMFAAPIKKGGNASNGKGKSGKKKRDKGMLLFATGGQRKY